jgi:hypothetical protein
MFPSGNGERSPAAFAIFLPFLSHGLTCPSLICWLRCNWRQRRFKVAGGPEPKYTVASICLEHWGGGQQRQFVVQIPLPFPSSSFLPFPFLLPFPSTSPPLPSPPPSLPTPLPVLPLPPLGAGGPGVLPRKFFEFYIAVREF